MTMHDLCKQLATGTSVQQQRAWRTLITEGVLWRGCLLAVNDLSQLGALVQDYDYLSDPSVLDCAKQEHPNDAEEAERLATAARRAVAAAVVAALARHRTSVEEVERRLLLWAYRAATLNADDPPSGLRFDSNFLDDAATLVRRCFTLLAPHRDDGWQLGAAQAAVLRLLDERSSRRLGNVPILLVQNGNGLVAWLSVELLTDGFGEFFPSPQIFRVFGEDWREAINAARQRVPFPDNCDVQWEIDSDVSQVDGASAQAAFQAALTLLRDERLYDKDCALSATVDDDGKLGRVDGIVGEHGAAGPKLLAAQEAGLKRVVVSPSEFDGLAGEVERVDGLEVRRVAGLEVVKAETMEKAISIVALPQSRLTYSYHPPAKPLITPRPIGDVSEMYPQKTLRFGPIALEEVAEIPLLAHETTLEPASIIWEKMNTPYVVNPFWTDVDRVYPLEGRIEESDRIIGKHIRLAAAGFKRDSNCVGFLWQPISWEQDRRTNDRIKNGVPYEGYPIPCWFREDDLIAPPLESDKCDPPFANRFAIVLAVILRTSMGTEYAVFQKRPRDVYYNPEGFELGASESVHGDRGWSGPEEIDVVNGVPDVKRTALRCLWQELGISEKGKTETRIPEFDIEVKFTALVLNKEEFTPRLLGFAIIRGDREDFETASRKSFPKDREESISHTDFGVRKFKDAVSWEKIICRTEATPAALAWILKEKRKIFSPECRARLIFYLCCKFGKHEVERIFNENFQSAKPPDWWPGSAL